MKNAHAVALGRLGASKGGQARAKSLSAEVRSQIARKAATTRWAIPETAEIDILFSLQRAFCAMTKKDQQFDLESDLKTVVALLERAKTPYAIIGGVAVQIRKQEPRATNDIDIAVPTWEDVPRTQLLAAGFTGGKRHRFWENRKGPKKTVVQFSADLPSVVSRGQRVRSGRLAFCAADVPDLIAMKSAAALDSERRPSKRLVDMSDVIDLVERYPAALKLLDEETRERVRTILRA